MDEPRDCHTEWEKSGRERKIPHDTPYMWNLKKRVQMNLSTKTEIELIDVENKFTVTKG